MLMKKVAPGMKTCFVISLIMTPLFHSSEIRTAGLENTQLHELPDGCPKIRACLFPVPSVFDERV